MDPLDTSVNGCEAVVCKEGVDAPVVLKPSVSVCACLVRDTRGSKEGGHDPADPVGEKIINQPGAEQNRRGDGHTPAHTHCTTSSGCSL